MELLNNILWYIAKPITTAKKFDDKLNEYIELTEEEWNTVVLSEGTDTKVLIAPTRCFGDKKGLVYYERHNPITLKEFLTKIYDFYNTPLCQDDKYSYNYDNVIHDIVNYGPNKVIRYIDLIGDKLGFEGIKCLDVDVYSIKLG